MFFLSKEQTSKDQQLKTQMLMSLSDDESKKTVYGSEMCFLIFKEVN